MRSIVFILTAAISISRVAYADVTFSVDLDLMTAGNQSSLSVVNGNTITGAIVLEVTGSSQFTAYDSILEFDPLFLDFGPNTLSGFVDDGAGNRTQPIMTNRVNLGASGFSLTTMAFDLGPATDDFPLSSPPNPPRFSGIAGISFGNALSSPVFDIASGGFVPFNQEVYRFTLTAIGQGSTMLNLIPAETPFGGGMNLGVPVYNGGQLTITAVPEPTSFAAIGIGTIIFGRQIRRRRRAKR